MRSLTPRERVLLLGAATLVAIGGLAQMVILPSLTSRQDSFAQLTKFEVVSAVLAGLPTQQIDSEPTELQPLRQRVTDTARRAGLDIRRLDPQGAAALSVSLDDVAFAALVGWIVQLTETAEVQVLSAEIGRRTEPGTVSARFLLEAK